MWRASARSLVVARRQRERALLEGVDAVLDVRGVRVDGRQADRGEVVREVVGGVEPIYEALLYPFT